MRPAASETRTCPYQGASSAVRSRCRCRRSRACTQTMPHARVRRPPRRRSCGPTCGPPPRWSRCASMLVRLIAPGPVAAPRRTLRRRRCAAPFCGLRAKQLERARARQGHKCVEIAQQVERAQQPNQVGELRRLSALNPDQRALGDACPARQIRLREIRAQSMPGKALAKLCERRRVGSASSEVHTVPVLATIRPFHTSKCQI